MRIAIESGDAPRHPPTGKVTRRLAYLDRAIACCEAIFLSATVNIAEDGGPSRTLVSACLLARSVLNARAVQKLIDAGLVVEARTLVRSILENQFYLYALAKEGKAFLDKMVADERFSQASRGQVVLEGPFGRERMGEDAKAQMKAFLRKIGGERKAPLKPREVIKKYHVRDAYIFYQELSADAAHPSLTALNRHVVAGKEGAIRGLIVVPPINVAEVLETTYYAAMALLGVGIASNTIFGGTPSHPQLEELAAEFQALAKATLYTTTPDGETRPQP